MRLVSKQRVLVKGVATSKRLFRVAIAKPQPFQQGFTVTLDGHSLDFLLVERGVDFFILRIVTPDTAVYGLVVQLSARCQLHLLMFAFLCLCDVHIAGDNLVFRLD